MAEVGENIRRLLQERGWSQAELSRRSRGVSEATISQLLSGKHQELRFRQAKKLARAFDVSVGELLWGLSEQQIHTASIPIRWSVPGNVADQWPSQSIADQICIPTNQVAQFNSEMLYAVKITNNSLLGDGISQDDYLVVDEGQFLNGAIHIIEYQGQRMARHVFRDKDRMILTPANPITEVKAKDVKILGLVVLSGHWRSQIGTD